MALESNLVAELAGLKRRGALDNFTRIVEIGAQQLTNNLLLNTVGLDDLYKAMGKTRPCLGSPKYAGTTDGIDLLHDDAPSSRQFWESLGFGYSAIEFDGHRNSIALDLNRDRVPRRMRNQFDIVVNWGTTEHVANQDNAFRVMHDLCAVNGVMMHLVPAGGLMNHGLINYNTKFFWHLCRENEYEVLILKTLAAGTNPVPQNIIDSNQSLGAMAEIDQPISSRVVDFLIIASLRKKHDRDFVTPLDIPADLVRRHKRGALARLFG